MSFRTGFIARSFIPMGPLTVSFGYGPLEEAIIPAAQIPEMMLLAGKTAPRILGPFTSPDVPDIVAVRSKKSRAKKKGSQ